MRFDNAAPDIARAAEQFFQRIAFLAANCPLKRGQIFRKALQYV